MKNKKTTILSALAIFSLLAIGAILVTGILKKTPNNETKKSSTPQILGEILEPQLTPTPTPLDINRLVQDSFQNTKEIVVEKATEKISEVEKVIINTINKEVSSLSGSQIEALKIQICRDLGVITTAPTKQP